MKQFMTKIIQHYTYHMKLQTKFIFSHMILILVPSIVVAVFLYSQIYNFITDNTVNSEQAISRQTASTLETTLAQISYAANTIQENELFQELFLHPEEIPTDAVLKDTADTLDTLVSGMLDVEAISDIVIYYEEPFAYLSILRSELTSLLYTPAKDVKSAYWYGIFNSTDTDALFCPALYLSPAELENRGGLAYIQRFTTATDPDNTSEERTTAYVAIFFEQEMVDEIMAKNSNVTDSVTYIINERASLVSTSDAALSATYSMLDQEQIHDIVDMPSQFVTHTFMDDNIYIGYYEIIDTDWDMVTVIPQDHLMEQGMSIIIRFVALYLLFLILALVLALWLSRTISRRVSAVVTQMETVRTGKPIRLEGTTEERDEIGNLKDTYNYMTDEINHLMDKQEQAARDLRLSEFKALQSQINPHFLYNTLDMINWLSLSDQKEDLTDVVQSLSRFYKLTLSKKGTTVPVAMEIEHSSLYVKIQNIRYENRIDFVVDIPDHITDCIIPKLTFQPIIENAIQHGIMLNDDKAGTIVLTGWQDKNDIVFLISDDGVGMTEELCHQIINGEYENKNSSNIGVFNTHHRLQLLYGDEYGLTYHSEPGAGTEVEIKIPYITEAPE